MRHCTDPTCLIDDCALWDVVMPRTTITPKEYTEKGRHEWAQQMAEIYPDGIDILEEDPYLVRMIDQFDRHHPESRTVLALLRTGMTFADICKQLGIAQKYLPLYVSKESMGYTAGQFFLLEEMVLSGEPMRMADIVGRTGLTIELVRRVVKAIGPRHEWLTPEGSQKTYTYEQRDAILRGVDGNVPMTALAEEHDLPYSTVVKLVRNRA